MGRKWLNREKEASIAERNPEHAAVVQNQLLVLGTERLVVVFQVAFDHRLQHGWASRWARTLTPQAYIPADPNLFARSVPLDNGRCLPGQAHRLPRLPLCRICSRNLCCHDRRIACFSMASKSLLGVSKPPFRCKRKRHDRRASCPERSIGYQRRGTNGGSASKKGARFPCNSRRSERLLAIISPTKSNPRLFPPQKKKADVPIRTPAFLIGGAKGSLSVVPKVEQTKQIPDRRAVHRNVGVPSSHGIGEVVAAPLRHRAQTPVPLDELQDGNVVAVLVVDVPALRVLRHHD